MKAYVSEPGQKRPWLNISGATFKAMAGSAFLMAAVFEVVSVWITDQQRLLDQLLQWLFPIAGALAGYLLAKRDRQQSNGRGDV